MRNCVSKFFSAKPTGIVLYARQKTDKSAFVLQLTNGPKHSDMIHLDKRNAALLAEQLLKFATSK
jgi:hypothetical protein